MEGRHRKSIRLKGYDYSYPGLYFITICTKNRECLFGDVVDGKMRLSEIGKIVEMEWQRTPNIRPNVQLDYFVVMPNHVHVIVYITHKITMNGGRGVLQYAPTNANALQSPSQTVGAIIRGFKSSTTKQINEIRNSSGDPVWQRNYYEHIIRDENTLERVRAYIVNNPINWDNDKNNPKNL